jgi:hypothetical protein
MVWDAEPVAIAFRFGSTRPSAGETWAVDVLTANLWGLVLILLGFVGQCVGTLIR